MSIRSVWPGPLPGMFFIAPVAVGVPMARYLPPRVFRRRRYGRRLPDPVRVHIRDSHGVSTTMTMSRAEWEGGIHFRRTRFGIERGRGPWYGGWHTPFGSRHALITITVTADGVRGTQTVTRGEWETGIYVRPVSDDYDPGSYDPSSAFRWEMVNVGGQIELQEKRYDRTHRRFIGSGVIFVYMDVGTLKARLRPVRGGQDGDFGGLFTHTRHSVTGGADLALEENVDEQIRSLSRGRFNVDDVNLNHDDRVVTIDVDTGGGRLYRFYVMYVDNAQLNMVYGGVWPMTRFYEHTVSSTTIPPNMSVRVQLCFNDRANRDKITRLSTLAGRMGRREISIIESPPGSGNYQAIA